MLDLHKDGKDHIKLYALLDENLFFVTSSDPWYGKILIYLQTQRFPFNFSYDEQQRVHHHKKTLLIISDTLYYQGVNKFL
jgi:hypothetical protein